MGVIYKIKSPSGRLYIGKTYDLRKRVNAYKCDVRKGSKNLKLHNSLRKYGWDAHVLEVVEEVSDELLSEREMYWIEYYKTYCYENPKGLNMTKGGDGQRSTWMHDVERREKQSEVFSGEGNPFYGKSHTEETKKLLSEKISRINKEQGKKIPEWGVEKGREVVRRPIVMYDLKGKFVKEFKSLAEASKELKISHASISENISGKKSQAKGYIFRYREENYPLVISVGEVKKQTVKREVVGVYAGEVMTFPSALEASEFFKIPKTTINRAAMYNGGRPIRTGHQFYYKDFFIKKQNRPHIAGCAT
jgi:group I intron endonuclease